MAHVPQALVIIRRTLLVIGWILVIPQLLRRDDSVANASMATPFRAAFVSHAPAATTAAESPVSPPIRDIPKFGEHGRPMYVADRLIVQFRENVSRERAEQIIAAENSSVVLVLDARASEYVVALPSGATVPLAAERFSQHPEVAGAEPDILHYTNFTPNDALYANVAGNATDLQRWYYDGYGADRNLNAENAWNYATGRSDVIVAVIDTGVLLNHPDLVNNIWTNPDPTAGDVHGWDFYNYDNDPNPDLGNGMGDANVFHGTFVAGVIAAEGNNGVGVSGVTWHSQIMALKVFTDDGGAPASAIAAAIYYAANHNADVINMSLGSTLPSGAIKRAARYAWKHGAVLVAAAGNDNSSQRQYPASFKPFVISVGGTSSGLATLQARASFSQFGRKAVDVVAPAVDIVSTAVLSKYDETQGYGQAGTPTYFLGSGTSFASPMVAGEAALLISRARDTGVADKLTNADYRRIILNATVALPNDPADSPNAGPQWDNHGRVDLLAAILKLDSLAASR